MQILITSFGPFKNSPTNPSNEVMNLLKDNLDYSFLSLNNLTWQTLDVSWVNVENYLNSIDENRFDLIIHLGVAIKNSLMRIEINAKNKCAGIDISGDSPKKSFINEIEQNYTTNFDINLIEKFVTTYKNQVRISDDAGAYLCNYIYYKSLKMFSKKSKVLFIHIADFLNNQDAVSIEDQVNLIKELYEKALYKMETEFPGTINYLNLLAAAHDFVSKEMAADLFGMKPSEFEQRILAGCSELLYENSITTSVEDYQLFHESLREYLKEKYNSEISEWNEKIADYCKDWQEENKNLKLQKAALRYAMSFATTHLYDSWLENKEDKPALAAERKESMLALIDNQEWRYKNFEVLGNAKALQQAYQLAQKVIVADDKEGEQLAKVLTYANAIHHEPFEMYLHQRKRLQKAIPTAELPKQLETLIDLANMGESATTKLMLLYTALWSSDFKGVSLPTSFTTKTEEWLELARDNSLKKMWGFVQQKTKI